MLLNKDTYTLSFADVAKSVIQYKHTLINNIGKRSAIIEASEDGFTWVSLVNIPPNTSTPLTIEALYIRLVSDTQVVVKNTFPTDRTNTTSPLVTLDVSAFALKDQLIDYVTKQELLTAIANIDNKLQESEITLQSVNQTIMNSISLLESMIETNHHTLDEKKLDSSAFTNYTAEMARSYLNLVQQDEQLLNLFSNITSNPNESIPDLATLFYLAMD